MLTKYAGASTKLSTSAMTRSATRTAAIAGITYEPIERLGRASVSVWAVVATGR